MKRLRANFRIFSAEARRGALVGGQGRRAGGRPVATPHPVCATTAAVGLEGAHIGDALGRVHSVKHGCGMRTSIETHGAAVTCVLEADLVGCGGAPGLAIGSADGCVIYVHDGHALCRHQLTASVTALAAHRDAWGQPGVAAADAAGVVVVFGLFEQSWRVRLHDIPALCAPAAHARALVSIDVERREGTEGASADARAHTLAAAVGGECVILLGPSARPAAHRAPAPVTAMCAPGAPAAASIALLATADGAVHAIDAHGVSRRIGRPGGHVCSLAALDDGRLIACAGMFDGVLVLEPRDDAGGGARVRHVRAGAGRWALALRLERSTDDVDGHVDGVRLRAVLEDGAVGSHTWQTGRGDVGAGEMAVEVSAAAMLGVAAGSAADAAAAAAEEEVAAGAGEEAGVDGARWLEVLDSCVASGEWDEGLIAAVPAVLSAGAHAAAHPEAWSRAVRGLQRCAAMVLPKGWAHLANFSADWVCAAVRAAAAARDGERAAGSLALIGGGLAVGAVHALHVLSSAGGVPPRRLLLCDDVSVAMGPWLRCALREAGLGVELDCASPTAETGAVSSAETSVGAARGGDLVVWEPRAGGPSTQLLERIGAARARLGAGAPTMPISFEVWAQPVRTPQGSRRSLDRVLNVADPLDGWAMTPLAQAVLRAGAPAHVNLDVWEFEPLAPPKLAYTWTAVDGEGPATWTPFEATADGVASAVVAWTEYEILPGKWTQRAPASAGRDYRREAACASAAGPTEPERHAACTVPPTQLSRGQIAYLHAIPGRDGLSLALRTSAPDALPRPAACAAPCALPGWCAWMMNDAERAAAYDAALRATVRAAAASVADELLVLDIGCGAGLLMLLAARAACATRAPALIVGVERRAELAEIAEATLAANRHHFAPSVRFRVVCAEASQLRAEAPPAGPTGPAESAETATPAPLPRRADVVVSEVFGDDPLAEGAVATLGHARDQLLANGGALIPNGLTILGALAVIDTVDDMRPRCWGAPGSTARLLELPYASADLRDDAADARHEMVSELTPLRTVRFDAPTTNALDARGRARLRVVAAGTPTAIVSCFELALCDGVTLSTAPSSRTHWRQIVTPIAPEVRRSSARGSHVWIEYSAARDEVRTWPSEAPGELARD